MHLFRKPSNRVDDFITIRFNDEAEFETTINKLQKTLQYLEKNGQDDSRCLDYKKLIENLIELKREDDGGIVSTIFESNFLNCFSLLFDAVDLSIYFEQQNTQYKQLNEQYEEVNKLNEHLIEKNKQLQEQDAKIIAMQNKAIEVQNETLKEQGEAINMFISAIQREPVQEIA